MCGTCVCALRFLGNLGHFSVVQNKWICSEIAVCGIAETKATEKSVGFFGALRRGDCSGGAGAYCVPFSPRHARGARAVVTNGSRSIVPFPSVRVAFVVRPVIHLSSFDFEIFFFVRSTKKSCVRCMCAASCTCAADGPSSKKVRFSFRGGFDECGARKNDGEDERLKVFFSVFSFSSSC